jgi:hypothetical protein
MERFMLFAVSDERDKGSVSDEFDKGSVSNEFDKGLLWANLTYCASVLFQLLNRCGELNFRSIN